ncbi:hypothetical protein AWB64_05998 [Caballeronia sordidicola]|uniref:Uncharacterized protein n=1 Tax=Caballeronia sordidicola TaxID=196367 RepID=A0A158IDG9_CABSO|nr:hypothetical protein [Caballeronia sordidicola]SAL54507.1 hypothetical protein AWB64_05998 [Caballeronia sordidicola]
MSQANRSKEANQVTNFVTPEGNKVTTHRKLTKFVTSKGEQTTISLTNLKIRERLSEVDWADSFDWSKEGQEARARRACEMLGWEMVIADHVDDGQWGGFQVRINEYMGNGLHEGAVAGEFGFELYSVDMLRLARDHITGWDREDTFDGSQTKPIEIPEALIGVLAYPLFEYQQRPQ